MLIRILIILAIVIVVFLVIVAMQAPTYRVTRSTTINAPAERVFEQVNDFHNWNDWSPWAKIDPNSKVTFEGPASGTGAIFMWSGNNKVGEGKMTMIESRPNELIRIKLDFVRPFKSTSTAEFEFKPQGDQTLVTWNMIGEKNFMSKAFCMFVNMDKMLGGDFERGLANLKSICEAR